MKVIGQCLVFSISLAATTKTEFLNNLALNSYPTMFYFIPISLISDCFGKTLDGLTMKNIEKLQVFHSNRLVENHCNQLSVSVREFPTLIVHTGSIAQS